MKKSLIKKMLTVVCSLGIVGLCSFGAQAGLISSVFDGSWTQFQVSDNPGHIEDYVDVNRVYPGWGGQMFDAEYLLYKQSGNILFLGLQTGFDLSDGVQSATDNDGVGFYSGDLALSFDGLAANDSSDPDNYEYAFDFGLLTKNYDGAFVDVGSANGIDVAGLYSVDGWNNEMVDQWEDASSPFAMDDGTRKSGYYVENSMVYGNELGSYYRYFALDLNQILGTGWTEFDLAAHWTMSCGNDVIAGSVEIAPVPEPATMLLFGTGLVGLAGVARKRKMKK